MPLFEDLSEEEAATALVIVERRCADPMLQVLATGAPDDEPSNPSEDLSAREGARRRRTRRVSVSGRLVEQFHPGSLR